MAVEFCLRKVVAVGGKDDAICPNSILLLPDKPLTFGRIISTETNVRLLSRSTPLMISRKHATVSNSAGRWTVLDHESLNGVFLNGHQILPNTQQALQIGDNIAFGLGVDSGRPEFEYVLETMSKAKKRHADSQPCSSRELLTKQRKILSESDRNVLSPSCSRDTEVLSCESQAEDMVKAAEDKIEMLKTSLEEKEKCYENVTQQLKKTETAMESKLLQQKATLETEKEDLEKNLKELMAKSLQEKEELLCEQLARQKALLIKEKEKVEENLQQELNRKLEIKDKELEDKLRSQKTDLEKIIAEKERQQSLLQQELSDYKGATERLQDLEQNERRLITNLKELKSLMDQKDIELQQQLEVTKKAEEAARKTVVEEMEDEFSCIICQELFIHANTLTCSHSFCEYCLQSWLNKMNSCPICRCPVQARPVRSRVLDNAIAKMVDSMDQESKIRRQAMLQERVEKSREVSESSGTQRNPIVLNDGEGRRHVRFNNEVPVIVDPRRVQPSGRWHNQRHHEGYGGETHYHDRRSNHPEAMPRPFHRSHHGLCFVCGMRGHWARGCPYRR